MYTVAMAVLPTSTSILMYDMLGTATESNGTQCSHPASFHAATKSGGGIFSCSPRNETSHSVTMLPSKSLKLLILT